MKRSGCGVVMAVLIIACLAISDLGLIIGGLVAKSIGDAGVVLNAGTRYCIAVTARDYALAYSYLSPAVQARITETAYVQASKVLDTRHGPIRLCEDEAKPDNAPTDDATHVHVYMQVSRDDGVTKGYFLLAGSGGAWAVDRIDASLALAQPPAQ